VDFVNQQNPRVQYDKYNHHHDHDNDNDNHFIIVV
jgi:hypothetical protein